MTNTSHTLRFPDALRIVVVVKVQSEVNAQKVEAMTDQLSDSTDELLATVEQNTPKKEP